MKQEHEKLWSVIHEYAPYIHKHEFQQFAEKHLILYVTDTSDAQIHLAAWLAIKVAEAEPKRPTLPWFLQ